MARGKILIIDDHVQILNSLRILLKDDYETIDTIKNPNLIPEKIQKNSYDIILLDMNFAAGDTSGNEGIFWLRKILTSDPLAVILLITAYGDIELAVRAIKEGATDFITKPWNTGKLLTTLKNAYELRQSKLEVNTLRNKQKQLTEDIGKSFKMHLGSSPAIKKVMDTLNKVSDTDANILIVGENGTGKELFAREIHLKSNQSNDVFIGVDVASLSDTLFESEMFGHVKGAFTDAKEGRPGRFEVANGGTLFLDEIGNLSLNLQAKLLQVIQNREVTRVGSVKSIPVDIRLICATNKPIQKMVYEHTFREDLFYRLNTVQIEIPPLRERSEDIPGLAEFFLEEYTQKYEKPFLKLNSKAIKKLCSYTWPGNIRELKHTIEKAVILCDSHTIKSEDFYLDTQSLPKVEEITSVKLSDVEKKVISKVINQCKGNYTQAARLLDISRTTLYAKLKRYGL